MASPPRIVVTAGEPAGIGPDIVLQAAQRDWAAQLVCVADQHLLAERAQTLGLDLKLVPYASGQAPALHQPGVLPVLHIPCQQVVEMGKPCSVNASYVLATLSWGIEACMAGDAAALVTAPVQKSIIADSGVPFSGHTEFLAEATGTEHVVMLLASGDLRVALATTHLPLSDVPAAIQKDSLTRTLGILHQSLTDRFGIDAPRITVLGLNPHAGEGGHLGREEIEVIAPVCDALRAAGHQILGPIPADTAFSTDIQASTDAYLAMYHDQGLPVLKYAGFGEAVNITLGLPIVRTSVDHGTALSLAGTGKASPDSLYCAIDQAIRIARQNRNST